MSDKVIDLVERGSLGTLGAKIMRRSERARQRIADIQDRLDSALGTGDLDDLALENDWVEDGSSEGWVGFSLSHRLAWCEETATMFMEAADDLSFLLGELAWIREQARAVSS